MDNIFKIASVNANMGESHEQAAYKKMERAKAVSEKETFGDIYDVRMLSAELNKSSADFKGILLLEAGKELNKVIGNLEQMERTEELIASYPSEDVIALSKLITGRYK